MVGRAVLIVRELVWREVACPCCVARVRRVVSSEGSDRLMKEREGGSQGVVTTMRCPVGNT